MAVTGHARADYGRAAEELATRVPQVLHGLRGPGWLAEFAAETADRTAALAAVRILDVELLSAHLLGATPLGAADTEVLEQALHVFPLTGADGAAERLRRARDWAVVRLAGDCGAGLEPAAHMAGLPPPAAPEEAEGGDWHAWSSALAALAALAVPGLDSPLHRGAAAGGLAIARGATRSVLRRDLPVAAALTRWLALPGHDAPPLRTALLIEHITACDGTPRTVLHLRIASHLLGRTGGRS
ncbi:hypothetical protein HUT06_34035 [Actinomadura sp. NAK00032]|uniref:hypothetical protein n=1 Tax=Actinomadura sp. NAK00032 TaxID=2742128 RepID=UPI0015902E74|nr:hypothetical protein [Actinomadura sp. NAK00032]QKW38417.1 hypothetical protein HUT06_34035 [Actinomadura sp. NAK00032]